MREIIPQIEQWLSEGKELAVATIVESQGSLLRGTGAKIVFSRDGSIAGSVSGGCVENGVIQAGIEVLESGKPKRLHFEKVDEPDWNIIGLACGGQIDVFITRLDEIFFGQWRRELALDRPFHTATILSGSDCGRQLVIPKEDKQIEDLLPGILQAIQSDPDLCTGDEVCRTIRLDRIGLEPCEVFVEAVPVQPRLVMIGGVHIAVSLASMASMLGFQTILIDPRRAFGNRERFPYIDRLLTAWPVEALNQIELDARTAVVTLAHDDKIDDPALEVALRSPAFYVGALGSQLTQTNRRERLLKNGLLPGQVDRLHGPIGFDFGARTPPEIALEILAEIVAERRRAIIEL